ncbi:nuclear pore complex protein NUP43-like isoform X2 [Bidens hawaiensis]|uniref:nuclear pore complex protein NUP43-like isoform X2 n=1 Tax=Bidens hawaiensis TaxID=980011 RepID=UPI00404932F3
MATTETPNLKQFQRLPQSTYIDSLRFLPPLSALDRYVVVSSFNSDSNQPSIQLHSIHSQTLTLHSSFTPSSRTTSLKVALQNPLIAASTVTGSLHILSPNPIHASFDSEVSLPENTLHLGPISGLDLQDNGAACVSVGEDGRVNLISVGDSGLEYRRVFDSRGLVSYTAARWASPTDFATGGLGNSVQWWDLRRPGGPVSQFKGNWATSGIVHSIDIHPSRKHTCLAGGSYGTVFAWDLRRPQQPIVLSGIDNGETTTCISESDVWEVQYDTYMSTSDHAKLSSKGVLPAMICSEDGILAVLKQGEEPTELLTENCAINCFDIDRQNPSDVICGLEWESIALLTRA